MIYLDVNRNVNDGRVRRSDDSVYVHLGRVTAMGG